MTDEEEDRVPEEPPDMPIQEGNILDVVPAKEEEEVNSNANDQ